MSLSLLFLAAVTATAFFQLGALTVWTMVLAIALRAVVGVVVFFAVFGLGYLPLRRYRRTEPSKSKSDDSGPTTILP